MTYFKETNAGSLIKRPIFLVINSQLFLLYNFSKFLYIFTLFIHPSILNITNKTLHRPDDGSVVSILFLNKSPLSIWITCRFFFTNCLITIHYFLPYIYREREIERQTDRQTERERERERICIWRLSRLRSYSQTRSLIYLIFCLVWLSV